MKGKKLERDGKIMPFWIGFDPNIRNHSDSTIRIKFLVNYIEPDVKGYIPIGTENYGLKSLATQEKRQRSYRKIISEEYLNPNKQQKLQKNNTRGVFKP